MPTKLNTAYLDLIMTEYRLSDKLRGIGGAIVLSDNGIVLASSEGHFFFINLTNKSYRTDYLPSISLNADRFLRSKRITYRETLPRVHDIIFHDGFYYLSYDRYNENTDSINMCNNYFFSFKSIMLSCKDMNYFLNYK